MRRMFKRKKLENYSHLEVVERPNLLFQKQSKLIINLEYANVDGKFKAIQVTSTLASEGKTTLVGNMAILLAQRNYKVIVIDLDLRKPKCIDCFSFLTMLELLIVYMEVQLLDKQLKNNTWY